MVRSVYLCLIITLAWVAGLTELTYSDHKTSAKASEKKMVSAGSVSFTVKDSFSRAMSLDTDIPMSGSKELLAPVSSVFKKAVFGMGCEITDYSHIVRPVAKQYGVDWRLVTAVMAAESSFNPCATSPVGAMGLMQLMPKTAMDYRVQINELYRPEKNISAGVQHLRRLNKVFKGNLTLTVAAYNAGEGAVAKFKGIPPFQETRDYVKKVMAYHKVLKKSKAHTGGAVLAMARPAPLPQMTAK